MAQRVGMDADTRQEFQLPTGQGFPDIWQEILGYFTDAADFQNLLLASPEYFEPLLEDLNSALLFPLALKVLDRMDHIPKSTTLESRLLSKFTKETVDKWIRDRNPCLENLKGWDHDWLDPKHDDLHCWMPSPVPKWQNRVEYRNPKCNPFLGGCVTFDVKSEMDAAPQKIQDFTFLLAHFGNEIRYFKFHAYRSFHQCLELLGKFLQLMPNLRTLDICDWARTEEDKTEGFLASALPDLKDISTLKLYGFSIQLMSIVLEKYGKQVNKLCLEHVSEADFSQLPVGFVENLQHVSLPWIRPGGDLQEYLNPTQEWLTTLETLSVNIDAYHIEHRFTEVLLAVENCFQSSRKLWNLNIQFRGEINPNIASLFLPSLKRLWIFCIHCCLFSIDFILGMRETLDEFTLDISLYGRNERNEDSKFKLLMNRMHSSDFWDQMSKLERITIRWNSNARDKAHSIYRGQQKMSVGANE